MFDIEIHFECYDITSILSRDVMQIQQWINNQDFYGEEAITRPLNFDELNERFIEYYMSENEFFLKIESHNKIIGIFKGRVEFKNPHEVMIWCYILDSELRGKGIGTKILNQIILFFNEKLGITNFYSGIMEGSIRAIRFWNKNYFRILRISKGFFSNEPKSLDLLVLRRKV